MNQSISEEWEEQAERLENLAVDIAVPKEEEQIIKSEYMHLKEKLNKILWNNLEIGESNEKLRQMKANLQPELEQFIEQEISQALTAERKELREKVIVMSKQTGTFTRTWIAGYETAKNEVLALIGEDSKNHHDGNSRSAHRAEGRSWNTTPPCSSRMLRRSSSRTPSI